MAAQSKYSGEVYEEALRITKPNDELLKKLVHDFEKERANSQIPVTCFFELKPTNLMVILPLDKEDKERKKGKKVSLAPG